MKHKAEAITNYNFKSSDKLLLDANIWIFIYGPQTPNDKKTSVYSEAFSKILNSKSRVYIDVLIISEVINTYSRIKYNLLSKKQYNSFKQFRKSKNFLPIAQEVTEIVKRILKHCTRIDNSFASCTLPEVNNLLEEYKKGNSDFNDQIFSALCKNKGLKLVTDDGDFCNQEISILTANNAMLNPKY